MLDLLAERILDSIEETTAFIVPAGELVDEIEHATSELPVPVDDAVTAVHDFLERRLEELAPCFNLTSDAVKGRRLSLNTLREGQAEQYKSRKSDWLLVPIGLGGRPFLRLMMS